MKNRYVFTFRCTDGMFAVRETRAPSYAWALAFVYSADLLRATLICCLGPF